MKHTYINYFIDWVIFLAMLVLFGTGIVLWGWKKGTPPPAQQGTVAQVRPDSKPTKKTTEKTDASPAQGAQQGGQVAGPAAGQPQGLILWGLFRGNTFWGMTKNGGWKSIHCWVSILVLLPFMLLHLFLHLKWIVHVTASLFYRRPKDIAHE